MSISQSHTWIVGRAASTCSTCSTPTRPASLCSAPRSSKPSPCRGSTVRVTVGVAWAATKQLGFVPEAVIDFIVIVLDRVGALLARRPRHAGFHPRAVLAHLLEVH